MGQAVDFSTIRNKFHGKCGFFWLGMDEQDTDSIAGMIARVLDEQAAPEDILEDVIDFRMPFQRLFYCFENGLPKNQD